MNQDLTTAESRLPDRPLTDSLGRVHTSVRLSVTDRCNLRCTYCMPELDATFMPRDHLLTFEELHRLTELLVTRCGINDVRLTGGEPLVRRELDRFVAMLSGIPGLTDLSLTTNGILLPEQAAKLKAAGLKRLNISIDTLDHEQFKKLARRDSLDETLAGIEAAIQCGFESIKLNAIAIQGITEHEFVSLIEFAAAKQVVIRFIEFMPLDFDRAWQRDSVLSGDRLLGLIEQHFGTLIEQPRETPSQPAERFRLPEGGKFAGAEIGIIRSVSQPFCQACNRLRITADGSIRNCLFASDEAPIRDLLRGGASDEQLIQVVRDCVWQKKPSHGIDGDGFSPPPRAMYSIGG
ncbi:GTP 3',8-cyclase MoaA [Novipirellula rosea]|uniref:GTP 3',8-cyclase n=1 Tax=Novipirellula rosea TaxID=1031540 RepID=A0ABP8MR05_9BACT